jgi:hypothetical protein
VTTNTALSGRVPNLRIDRVTQTFGLCNEQKTSDGKWAIA